MKRRETNNEQETDAAILQAIERKRDNLYNNYNLPPDQQERAEMLFAEMERMGSECRNLKEFNERFFHQTLSREFYKLMLDNGIFVRFPAIQSIPEPAMPQQPTTTVATTAAKGAEKQVRCCRLWSKKK